MVKQRRSIQQYANFHKQPNRIASRQRRVLRQSVAFTCLTLLLTVIVLTFTCTIIAGAVSQTASLVAFQPPIARTSLPTFTPTSLPTLTPTISPVQVAQSPSFPPPAYTPTSTPSPVPIAAQPSAPAAEPIKSAPAPTNAPLPTATAIVLQAPVPTPSPTPVRGTSGWTFSGVTNMAGNSRRGLLLLMGELVNNTGVPQQAVDISGAFYGGQGEVPVDNLDLVSYVPVDPIPVNAHVPFELQVSSNQDIEHFDLHAWSQPANDPPRYDFQFSNVEQWLNDVTGYCIRGQVDDQGAPVQDYLVVLAVGYDDQGSVVNFGEYYVDVLPGSGAPSSPFELCLDPLDRQLSRHDLLAFGY